MLTVIRLRIQGSNGFLIDKEIRTTSGMFIALVNMIIAHLDLYRSTIIRSDV